MVTPTINRNRKVLWLLLLVSAGKGCSGAKPSTVPPENGVAAVAEIKDIRAERPAIPVKGAVDPLILKMKSDDWDEFERELRHYLNATKTATEESDRRLKDVTEAIERQLSTADISDNRWYLWRTKASRLILQQYKPRSYDLMDTLASHVSYIRGYTIGDLTLPNTENRLSDARLKLQTLKQVRDRIDPDFDPEDPRNMGMMKIAVPGHGPYYPGIAPDRVTDPVVREKYERAIAANRAKFVRLDDQQNARKYEKELLEKTRDFVRRAYKLPPAAFDELEQLLTELDVDPETRAQIADEARESILYIENRVKASQENEEKLAKLRAEGIVD